MTNTKTITINLDRNSYDIHIGKNLANEIPNIISPFVKRNKIFLICDESLGSIILPEIKNSFIEAGFEVFVSFVQSGENSKSFESLELKISELLDNGIERNDTVIAIGGGVIGDLAGFISSIIYRGINFIQVPTTLLAQVDSSVGGKTAINVKQGKNLIGSFYQPKAVITDVSFLSSLSEREIKCGLSEIIKYGVIGDRDFFNWLKENVHNLTKLNQDCLIYAIEKSCSMKANIVQKDEKEKGDRALLNFGHTFGHALEKHFTKNEVLLHGEAVAIGMVYASKFSSNIGVLKKDECNEIINLISDIGLPVSINDIKGEITKEEILNLMMFDKKRVNQKNTLILLNKIGEAFINNNVSDKEIIDFFNMENIQ